LSHSLEVLLLLLRDQFNSFSAETLTSEADGHPRRLARQHWPPTRLCQTARARLTGIGTSFLLGLVSGEGSNVDEMGLGSGISRVMKEEMFPAADEA
jgi:hypothetical protein